MPFLSTMQANRRAQPGLLDSTANAGLGALQWIGEAFDKPFQGVANASRGDWGNALAAITPFSGSLGWYDPKTRISGQDLLADWGVLDSSEVDAPLFSTAGLLGLGTELVLDPTNLLPGMFGLKAMTKGGRYAGKVAPHLDEVGAIAKAMGMGGDAAQAGGAFTRTAAESLPNRLANLEQRFGGKVLDEAGQALPEQDLLSMLAGQGSQLGSEASYLQAKGIAPRLAKTARERAVGKQEALFSVGGEYRPFGIGPSIEVPQFDIFSPTIQQGISNAGGLLRKAPGIKQGLDLFSRTPISAAVRGAKGMQEQVAREGSQAIDEAGKLFAAGKYDEAAGLIGPGAPPAAIDQAIPPSSVADQVLGARPQGAVGIPTMITKDMKQQLLDLGYTKKDINAMRPEDAHEILGRPGVADILGAKAPSQTIYNEPASAFEPLGAARKPMMDAGLRSQSNEAIMDSLTSVERSVKDLEEQISALPRSTPELSKQLGALQDIKSSLDNELFYRSIDELPSRSMAEALVTLDLSTSAGKTRAALLLASAKKRGLGYELQSTFERWGRSKGGKKLQDQLRHLQDISNDFDRVGKVVRPPDIAIGDPAKVVDISDRLEALWSMPPGQAEKVAAGVLDPKTAARFAGVAPAVRETQQRVARATGMAAPEIDRMAADFVADGLAPEAATARLRALADAVEGGSAPAEYKAMHDAITGEYKRIFDVESPWTGLKDLGDPYAAHVVTKAGRGFFENVAKAGPEAQQTFLQALNEVRAAKGLEPLKMQASQVGVRGTPTKAATGKPTSQAAAELLEQAGLGKEFMEEAMNGSMYARKYRGLTVNEINDVAKRMGAKGDVFEADPFKQLKVRGMQHAKVRGMIEFVKGLETMEVASKVKAADILTTVPDAKMPGVSKVTMRSGDSGFVPDILQDAGGQAVVFKTADEANEAGKALRWMNDDGKLEGAKNWYDQLTRIMKSAMTRGFPPFHMRNRGENRIKSNIEGVPFIGKHNGLAELAHAGKEFNVKLGDGTTMNYASMKAELDAMPQHKILGAGQMDAIAQEIAEDLKSAKAGGFNLLDMLEAGTEKLVQKIEPIAAAPAVLAGQALGGQFHKSAYTGTALENVDKLRHYIYKRMEGLAPEAAAENVMKAQFDYTKSAMNSFEREFMNRTMLFYGYTRSVVPYMVEKMATNSGKIAPWFRFANLPGKDENLPPWLREGMSVPLYEDEKSGQMRYARSLGTPIEAAVEPFSGFFAEGNWFDKARRGGQKMASGLNPMIKAPSEWLFGKDMFLGRDIDALDKAPEWAKKLPKSIQDALGLREVKSKEGKYLRMAGNAWGLWALRNSPLGRLSSTISKGTDERTAGGDVALNLLTGANVTTFDREREARFRQREAAVRQLKELEKQGLTRQFQVWGATDQGKQSEEARNLLNLISGR